MTSVHFHILLQSVPEWSPSFLLRAFWAISCVCVLFWFKEIRVMDGLIVHADALGSRAGNSHGRVCAPKEPPALVSPEPPLSWMDMPSHIHCGDICGVVHVWARVIHTQVSDGWNRESSEPTPHLAAPASHESVEHQCPAPGWNRRPGRMLWFPAAPEESERAEVHVYWVTTGSYISPMWSQQTGCPLPVTQAAARRLILLREPWFLRHFRGARHFIDMLYWNVKD